MACNCNPKRSAYLMIAASVLFYLAAALGKQVAFVGVGAAFMAIGASRLRKHKESSDGDTSA